MKSGFFSLSTFVLLLGISSFCDASQPIKLHIVVHSHMDEGWLWSFEEYYKGTPHPSWGIDYSGGCVECILNNVYQSLLKNPNRKYQIAETAFFKRWWSDQAADVKENVRRLLKQKQLEFVNGGWSANDEACPYYEDIIDNFIAGHRWIYNEFGLDPNVGWQIDSFGHSAAHAAFMAQAGYEGIFFGRLDYRDWDQRRANKTLEVNWKPQSPHQESLLGIALYGHYSNTSFLVADNYMCRSIFCRGRLNPGQIEKLKEEVMERSKSYRTQNVLMLVGDDFHLWQEAEKDYDGIEHLISKLNNDVQANNISQTSNVTQVNIQAKFSTISEYLNDMTHDYSEKLESFPSKRGDYFPYVEDEWTSWVGYYTSKAMFKLKIRETSQYYNAAKLLLSKLLISDNRAHSQINSALLTMEETLGIVQHHDAITGTMKEKVKKDYEKMLDEGRKIVDGEIIPMLKNYSEKVVGEKPYFVEGLDFNWRQKDPQIASIFNGQGDQKNVLVTVFNPGHTDTFLLKIKAPTSKFKVRDESNNYLVADIICNNQTENSDCYLYFVDEIPAFSLKTYILEPSALSKVVRAEEILEDQYITIGYQVNLLISNHFQNFHYELCKYPGAENPACLEDSFNLNYEYYSGNDRRKSSVNKDSGAYVFLPDGHPKKRFSPVISGKIFKGRHLTVIQIEREGVRTDLKFVHHELERGIEIESYFKAVDPKPPGKEIVLIIRSKNVQNDDQTFFTDQNGYYMQARKINERDFEVNKTNSNHTEASFNYYPITSAVYIQNPKTNMRMTVVTDRAQGATSLNPGEIEIMVHRQTTRDDWKGLDEVLQEVDPEGGPLKVSTRHYLMYSSPECDLKEQQRIRQYKLDRPLQYFLANVKTNSFVEPRTSVSSRVLNLESNIKLTIRSYEKNEYIVRLHNLNDQNSKIVRIYNLSTKLVTLLNDFADVNNLKLSSISELSLFTHKPKDQVQKNKFDPSQPDWKNTNDGKDLSSIELLPMEIRTFNIVLKE